MSDTQDANQTHNNEVVLFSLDALDIRGRAVRLDHIVDEIISAHDYPQSVSAYVAQLISLSCLFSSLFKFEGIFSLQVQSSSALKMLACDVTSKGEVRACASFDEDHADEDDFKPGEGYVVFTIDQESEKDRYQGIVQIHNGDLVETVQHYFNQSEQIPTGIKAVCNQDADGRWTAGGVLLQRLPDQGGTAEKTDKIDARDQWQHAMVLLSSLTDEEICDRDLSLHDVLLRLFHAEGPRVFDPIPLVKKCRCSRDKLLGVLRSMDPAERADITKEPEIEVQCEYCAEKYKFSAEDING